MAHIMPCGQRALSITEYVQRWEHHGVGPFLAFCIESLHITEKRMSGQMYKNIHDQKNTAATYQDNEDKTRLDISTRQQCQTHSQGNSLKFAFRERK